MSGHGRGFSLIEAVVAVAVLSLACVAVSGVLGTTLRGERSVERRRLLESVLAAEGERLAALPYHRRADRAGWPATPASLLGEVFPHASPTNNLPDAFYADGSGEVAAGTFVSDLPAGDLVVHRQARFVVASSTGVVPAPPESVSGWAVWSGTMTPAAQIEVELAVSLGGLTVTRRLVLGAVRPAVAPTAALLTGYGRVA